MGYSKIIKAFVCLSITLDLHSDLLTASHSAKKHWDSWQHAAMMSGTRGMEPGARPAQVSGGGGSGKDRMGAGDDGAGGKDTGAGLSPPLPRSAITVCRANLAAVGGGAGLTGGGTQVRHGSEGRGGMGPIWVGMGPMPGGGEQQAQPDAA